ncbi:MAG: hypothetical protein N2484_02275 [Clostridia bacterium]|nr:hypothetical protein [Clostridia bacterium]
MYGFVPPCHCLSARPVQPQTPASTYSVYKMIPVYLGGTPGTNRVVVFSSNSGLSSRVQVQQYDSASGQWLVEYQKEAEGIPFFSVLDGYWEAAGQNVVVLFYTTGSGGYLYYWVLGKKGGKIVEIVNRKEIFQGDVWLESGKLLEQYANRYRVWVRRNGRIMLIPYALPIIPGAKVLRYRITPKGEVVIASKNFSVPIGSVVQIIRTDLNPITERLLFGYTPTVKFLQHKSGFKFLDKGTLELTIIPQGYDWDKSVDIVVEAK